VQTPLFAFPLWKGCQFVVVRSHFTDPAASPSGNFGMNAVEPLLASSPADAVLNALAASGHRRLWQMARSSTPMRRPKGFFEVSVSAVATHLLRDLVPFGSPLLALIEQVAPARRRGQRVQGRSRHAAQSGRSAR